MWPLEAAVEPVRPCLRSVTNSMRSALTPVSHAGLAPAAAQLPLPAEPPTPGEEPLAGRVVVDVDERGGASVTPGIGGRSSADPPTTIGRLVVVVTSASP